MSVIVVGGGREGACGGATAGAAPSVLRHRAQAWPVAELRTEQAKPKQTGKDTTKQNWYKQKRENNSKINEII